MQKQIPKHFAAKKYMTVLYGEVVQVDGEKSCFCLKLLVGGGLKSGQSVFCECDKETADAVASAEYTVIGVSGLLETNGEGLPHLSHCSLLPYRGGKDGFARLREAGIGEAFRNVDADEYLAEIRGL